MTCYRLTVRINPDTENDPRWTFTIISPLGKVLWMDHDVGESKTAFNMALYEAHLYMATVVRKEPARDIEHAKQRQLDTSEFESRYFSLFDGDSLRKGREATALAKLRYDMAAQRAARMDADKLLNRQTQRYKNLLLKCKIDGMPTGHLHRGINIDYDGLLKLYEAWKSRKDLDDA